RVGGDVAHGAKRRDLEAGRRGRDHEDRDAVVLLGGGIGAGGEPDVVGVLRLAGEELAAVDHPVVAVAHRPGAERGEIGACSWLGVPDREVHLAAQRLRQEEPLLLLAAVLHDHRAHRHDRERRQEHARAPGLVEEDELFDGRAPLPAVLRGPPDAEPAVGAHPAERPHVVRPAALGGGELGLVLGGDDGPEVVADPVAQRVLLGGQVDEHGGDGYDGPRTAVKQSFVGSSRPPALGSRRAGRHSETVVFVRPAAYPAAAVHPDHRSLGSTRRSGLLIELLLVARVWRPQARAAPPPSPQVERGRELYGSMCAVCHGPAGEGYRADQAPRIAHPDFLSAVNDAYLRRAIAQGRPRTTMSAWAKERGRPLPSPDVDPPRALPRPC